MCVHVCVGFHLCVLWPWHHLLSMAILRGEWQQVCFILCSPPLVSKGLTLSAGSKPHVCLAVLWTLPCLSFLRALEITALKPQQAIWIYILSCLWLMCHALLLILSHAEERMNVFCGNEAHHFSLPTGPSSILPTCGKGEDVVNIGRNHILERNDCSRKSSKNIYIYIIGLMLVYD